jgi:hypothetical protein
MTAAGCLQPSCCHTWLRCKGCQRVVSHRARLQPALWRTLRTAGQANTDSAGQAKNCLTVSGQQKLDIVSSKSVAPMAAAVTLLTCLSRHLTHPPEQLLVLVLPALQKLEFSSKVADLALMPMLNACRPGAVAAWGGARVGTAAVVSCVHVLAFVSCIGPPLAYLARLLCCCPADDGAALYYRAACAR